MTNRKQQIPLGEPVLPSECQYNTKSTKILSELLDRQFAERDDQAAAQAQQ